jgi:hypothetical protein
MWCYLRPLSHYQNIRFCSDIQVFGGHIPEPVPGSWSLMLQHVIAAKANIARVLRCRETCVDSTLFFVKRINPLWGFPQTSQPINKPPVPLSLGPASKLPLNTGPAQLWHRDRSIYSPKRPWEYREDIRQKFESRNAYISPHDGPIVGVFLLIIITSVFQTNKSSFLLFPLDPGDRFIFLCFLFFLTVPAQFLPF